LIVPLRLLSGDLLVASDPAATRQLQL